MRDTAKQPVLRRTVEMVEYATHDAISAMRLRRTRLSTASKLAR